MRNLSLNIAIAVTVASIFVMVLSAQAGSAKSGAARVQVETAYILAADLYLPIQIVEPVY